MGFRSRPPGFTVLRESATSIETMDAILDWGCGSGRILRHWAHLAPTVRICGCDINANAVEWCREHLDFAEVVVNDISPPFPYPDSSFDLVYALSVFTHLPEELQHAWIRDCRRILKPNGYLLFTTMGERYLTLERLTDSELQAFRDGRVVVLYQRSAGSNLCSAYHPTEYVERSLGAGLRLCSFMPGTDSFPHDVYLFSKAS
jgi:SAM-dependent methyltransferase